MKQLTKELEESKVKFKESRIRMAFANRMKGLVIDKMIHTSKTGDKKRF